MIFSKQQLLERFQKYYTEFPTLGLSLDLSRIDLDDAFVASMRSRVERSFADMAALESGAIANPDEGRMVGHYWLRNSVLAPTPEIRLEIEDTLASVQTFVKEVHAGNVRGAKGPFKNYLLIGIGGSALGPQFVANALGHPATDKLRPYFFDNTDSEGMERVLAAIGSELGQTLCVVISKSGGTKETRNGMLEAQAAFTAAGVNFAEQAVAITQKESALDQYCLANGWLRRFPIWDWVGGRTSQMSAVGLLPAALQGFSINEILAGAKACDEITRSSDFAKNPAIQLALAWFCTGEGKGKKCMVVIPYRDRLELFSRYLQQLVMESLGKERDVYGAIVHQGITVLGNKGSTDQHSYIQQLRDGIDNSFVIFVNVLHDGISGRGFVDDGVTSGDYLHGFCLGTREALTERGRESITITIQDVSPFTIGILIALFERAVGYYASIIGINAYHQPGVESGKKAAGAILDLQKKVLSCMATHDAAPISLRCIANAAGSPDDIELVYRICERLAANKDRGVRRITDKCWMDNSYAIG